jgi:hypothetical protein
MALFFHLIILLALSSLMMACQQEPDRLYSTVSEGTLQAGEAVPAPSNEVVLTLSGQLNNTNLEETLAFDMQTLESIGLIEYTVPDPWLSEDVTYTGLLLTDLLAVADVEEGTQELFVVALDDYATTIPFSDIEEWPVILATRSNNDYMDVANSGPTRIIFPYDKYPNQVQARNMSAWNIKSIEIR